MGRAFAFALAQAGASVGLIARSAAELAQVRDAIAATGAACHAHTADAASPGQLQAAHEALEQALGPVDLLVNNAAIATPLGPLAEADPDTWWRTLEVNLRAPMLLARAALPAMRRRGRGVVINIVSRAGLEPVPHHSAYCVSKSALIRLTQQIALEEQPQGILAYALNPGPVASAMSAYLLESREGRQWLPAFAERFAQAEVPVQRVAEALVALAIRRPANLTGQTIDGATYALDP